MDFLIVEDNPDHLELTLDCIREVYGDSATCRHCDTLHAGLNLLHEHPPDVMLCDLQLPDSPMEATTGRLQALDSNVPVIVLTSSSDAERARKLVKQGIQDYLPKSDLSPVLLKRVCTYAVERQALINETRRAALHDGLTQLPNRAYFETRLPQAIHDARRRNERLALAYLDLDGFKGVNDTYGHAAGDALLCLVAQRLQDGIRRGDTCARLGGDEFVLVLSAVTSSESLRVSIDRIHDRIVAPYHLSVAGRDIEVTIGSSIGIALFPDDGADADRLLHHADEAMYRAKSRPGGGIEF